MKIVEDYAQRKVDKKLEARNREIVVNMKNEGLEEAEIAKYVDVSLDFVKKTLAK